MISNVTVLRASLMVAALLLISPAALAQSGLTTSRNSDFSTEDLSFEPGEAVYVRVVAGDIEATAIDENEVRLRHMSGGDAFEGMLHNNFDGSYVGRFELPSTDGAIGKWLLEIRLRDTFGHEVEARLALSVGAGFDAHEFEIEGLVTDIGDAFITVTGREIAVTSDTEVEDGIDQRLRLSDIQIGDRVHVRGVIRSGVPVAVRIELKGRDEHEIEFTGLIEEIRDRAIVMFRRVLHVTENTEILNSDGQIIPFSALEVGMMAAVKVQIGQDKLILRRIKVRTSGDAEFEVKGFVTEIGDRGFALEGHFIAVTEDTEFIGRDDRPVTFADLRVDDFVEVRGFIRGDRVPVARRVEIEDRRGPREFEVEGFIREIGDRAIAVAGLKILVTEDTRILGRNEEPIEFGMLKEGDYVEVHGFVGDDGALIARLIRLEDPDHHEIAVSGEVQRKGERVLVVKNIPFEVTDRTEIFDEAGDPFPFSEIQVGMFVRVKGLLFPDTRSAVALKIEVRTRRFVHLVGTINEVGDNAISVSGIRVLVTDGTTITGSNGELLTFSDLRVGQIVKVEGWKSDGGVVARTIKVRIRVEDEVLVAGVLEAIQDSVIVVLGVDFRILPDSRILSADGAVKALAELEVGRPIRVRGKLLADGTMIALSVREMDRSVRGLHVVGPIESIGPGTVEVIGIHFFVDGSTEIVGVAGQRMDLRDLSVGQTVALQGLGLPDGTRHALKIRLLDVLVAMGDAEILTSDHVRIFGVDFATGSDLVVLTDGVRETSLSSSTDQTTVEIRAATDETGVMRVSKVTLHLDSGSTTVAVDDGSEVPTMFDLRQNYPNPFNPSTTIQLEVFEAGAVDLAVYNVLGQRIATLSEQALAPGTYTFEWNGRDAAGTPAASGLYLYRAAVGGTVQTRTMTLVK